MSDAREWEYANGDRLLKVKEVCERTSLGRSMVFRLLQTQALKSVLVGSARRIREKDLQEFIRNLPTDGGAE